jgi:hypothetical protein
VQQHRRVALQVLDVEEQARVCLQQGLLVLEAVGDERQDRALGHRGVSEAAHVGLAERPFPGEHRAGDQPGAVAVAHALGHLGQLGDESLDGLQVGHRPTVARGGGPRRRAERG